jgi:diaminohydroxyphosphoribosylaminopyrimidine deaminase / 5-amino-6-(5-phosphoribosylamino)uracil reductase
VSAFPVRPAPHVEAALDERFMRATIALSRRGLGLTFPNPSVGAMIVAFDGPRFRVLGRGVTAPGGRPHAERIALQEAGEAARGATLYVSLEPCNRHSRSGFGPSCTDQIAAAGIARIVFASSDPSSFADGVGVRRLRQAGIEVKASLLAPEADRTHQGHLIRIVKKRPHVALKLAQSADGFAGRVGQEIEITGPAARSHVHLMRAQADAILVGIGTVLADDPELTCRLPGLSDRSPTRIVLDSQLRLPLASRLVATATLVPVWVIAASDADDAREQALRAAGIEVLRVERRNDVLDLDAAIRLLGDLGITRLMLEGGPSLAEAFAKAGLVDALHLWTAAKPLCGEGEAIPALGPALENWRKAPDIATVDRFDAGGDICEIFERQVV